MARGSRVRTSFDDLAMRIIGGRVRRARMARVPHMTQLELAPLLGYTRSTSIAMIECGHQPLRATDLLRLCNIFQKPIWWWYGSSIKPVRLADWVAETIDPGE